MFDAATSIAFRLGPLAIHWYGILIALGLLAGFEIAKREARVRKLSLTLFSDMVLWCGIGGIIGARLYYVLFNSAYYRNHAMEIFAVWNGGLAIHGAVLGGLLAFLLFAKRKKITALFSYLDCLALGLLVGQIIGRWGNFINQEAFGGPTNLPWGMYIDPARRPDNYQSFEYFHPTFLYESLWNGLLLIVLLYLNLKHRIKTGQTVALYFIGYGLGRFWIEALRTDSLMLGTIRVAQLVSLALIAVGVVIWKRQKPLTLDR